MNETQVRYSLISEFLIKLDELNNYTTATLSKLPHIFSHDHLWRVFAFQLGVAPQRLQTVLAYIYFIERSRMTKFGI